MSLPGLQSDGTAGSAHWLNHQFVNISGASDGTANGSWAYGSAAHEAVQVITYTASDKTWIDGSSSAIPDAITASGTHSSSTSAQNTQYVFLWNGSSQFLGKFQNPFYDSSWTPPASGGGGGTSTEGVPVPQGSVGRTGQTIVVTIDKNSPSSSTSVSYSIQKNGVSQGSGISHTNNTTTDFVQNLTFAPGIWRLWYQETGEDGVLLDTFNASESRKRHANFW